VLSLLVTALAAAPDPFNAVRFFSLFILGVTIDFLIIHILLGNQTFQKSSNEAAIIAALLKIDVPVNTVLGWNCSPITGIGRGGSTWYSIFSLYCVVIGLILSSFHSQAQTVCCQDNHFSKPTPTPVLQFNDRNL
jgi:hypothetical protein